MCRLEFTVSPSLKCFGRVAFRLPLTDIFWRSRREKGVNWCLLLGVVSCFEFLSCAVMASDTDDTDVTEVTEENAEQTGLSGVEKKKETDILLLQIKKRKRIEKTKLK